jgi:hypothetical protein
MTAWTLKGEAKHIFGFSAFSLEGAVQVWTKVGTNDADNLNWDAGR